MREKWGVAYERRVRQVAELGELWHGRPGIDPSAVGRVEGMRRRRDERCEPEERHLSLFHF